MKEFEKLLDLTPTEQNENNVPVVKQKNEISKISEKNEEQQQFDDDFEISRRTIQEAIKNSAMAMEMAFEIARDKEDAKSFEALNSLLKTMVSSSESLLNIQKTKKEFKKGDPKQEEDAKVVNNTQNNIVFNGNAKDLRKLLDKEKGED